MPEHNLPELSVSQALKVCNQIFEGLEFLVEGEVSGYGVSQGRWIFFDLKDSNGEAKVKCFSVVGKLSIELEDGMKVLMRARPSIHAKTGNFSFVPSYIEPRGEGGLKRAFELLKKKLEGEGLFALDRKRALPRIPQQVGIISSESAAGYGDFMQIAQNRLKGVTFHFVHVAVQGMYAEQEIVAAIQHLNAHVSPEVIVIVRGGGSLEDLQAFNTERVARAIVGSKAPVVVGVGHERDVTIADYVADVRASTPSNAAERLLPTEMSIVSSIEALLERIELQVLHYIRRKRQDTLRVLERNAEQIRTRVMRIYQQVAHQMQGSNQLVRFMLHRTQENVAATLAKIDALAPSNVMKRGYSITVANGKIVTSATAIGKGAELTTHLADGTLISVVTDNHDK